MKTCGYGNVRALLEQTIQPTTLFPTVARQILQGSPKAGHEGHSIISMTPGLTCGTAPFSLPASPLNGWVQGIGELVGVLLVPFKLLIFLAA